VHHGERFNGISHLAGTVLAAAGVAHGCCASGLAWGLAALGIAQELAFGKGARVLSLARQAHSALSRRVASLCARRQQRALRRYCRLRGLNLCWIKVRRRRPGSVTSSEALWMSG
jgi:hypothetical protein